MLLNITRPIVFFDLETTGVNIVKDRIVEISILKVFPNGNKESKTWIINPTIPIPNETTQIHGITDEKVKNEPTFKELFLKICLCFPSLGTILIADRIEASKLNGNAVE